MRERVASVRVRTTLGSVAVVGIALIVASVAMVLFLRRSLTDDVRASAQLRAGAVADLFAAGSPLDGFQSTADEEFVQVVDRDGDVVASTRNVAGQPALVDLAPGASARIEVPFEDDPFLAVATRSETPEGAFVVLLGRTLDRVEEATQAVVGLLAIGLPLLLLIVGAVTWWVTGRALAPVEAIRAEVERISTADLDRRVPVPQSGDEIARLGATMNRMLERLERGQARQRRFVSDASHELRSPVASIRQHAEVAIAHPSGASAEELARVVLDEDLRLQRLVEDLLMLARMDERGGDRSAEVLDLDDVVFEEVDRLRSMTTVAIDASKVSGGRVTGDRKQLQRVVGNLLDNALRHARGLVMVGLSEVDDRVVLSVEDDGNGIPPQDRERVFGRFERLQDARDRDSGGAGLGLAIVAEVAAAHGGTAEAVESSLGGARFEIRLHRAPD